MQAQQLDLLCRPFSILAHDKAPTPLNGRGPC